MHNATFHQLLHRQRNSHKYNFGHVLIIGGSSGMVGAPFLSAMASLRVGAGLVTIASDNTVIEKLEKRVEEIMTLAVPLGTAQSLSILNDYIQSRKVSVIVIGPGLSTTAAPLITAILQKITLPIVIDGGGLGMVANNPELLHVRASKQLILTPHLGELQRFFDKPFSNNKTTILNLAKNFAKEYKLILVMKGNNTITVTPKGKLYKNTTGGPALATAGTGDVLSGIIAGIIAQHITPEEAAPAAVYLHGLAGDLATVKNTEPGVIASDVIDYIPNALKSIELSIR